MNKGKIFKIESLGTLDGPGIRVVVFMYGCNLRCKYCHNPESWCGDNFDSYTPAELFEKIKKYKPYFKNNGGVTFTGGEPLMQSAFVQEVFKLCKKEGIHTCLDTAGNASNYGAILDYTDLILLDIKHIDEEGYKYITGKSMDSFNNFFKEVQLKGNKLWLRQVIVPEFNDTQEYIRRFKEYIKNIKNVEKVELLPYTELGKEKYKELGLPYKIKGTLDMEKFYKLNNMLMLEK